MYGIQGEWNAVHRTSDYSGTSNHTSWSKLILHIYYGLHFRQPKLHWTPLNCNKNLKHSVVQFSPVPFHNPMQTITKHSQDAFQFRTPTTAIDGRSLDQSCDFYSLPNLQIDDPRLWSIPLLANYWTMWQWHSLEIISLSWWPQVDDVKSSRKECNWSFADRLGLRYQLQKLHFTLLPVLHGPLIHFYWMGTAQETTIVATILSRGSGR